MNLIAISGKIGSGKSTFTNFLREELERKNIESEERFFASSLKIITKELCGYGGYTQEEKNIFLEDWGMSVGSMLQTLGTDVFRKHFDENTWIKSALKKLESNKVYIISDCRFKNEASYVKHKGGLLLRLNGDPSKTRENSNRNLSHPSEIDLDDYEGFDFIYNNTESIEELESFAKTIINKFF